jgi:hypothetical protein
VIEIILALSLLCIDGACEPALVGRATPTGVFVLSLYETSDPAYRGDVLSFHSDRLSVYAVHRPPSARRRALLSQDERPLVTNGCVNVTDEVYERLRDCCVGMNVVIR